MVSMVLSSDEFPFNESDHPFYQFYVRCCAEDQSEAIIYSQGSLFAYGIYTMLVQTGKEVSSRLVHCGLFLNLWLDIRHLLRAPCGIHPHTQADWQSTAGLSL